MTNFSEINLPESSDRRDNWQRHHIIPTARFTDFRLLELFDVISAENLPESIRYSHQLFDFNGVLLPALVPDSLAFGFAIHNGPHDAFSEFVFRILEEIQREYVLDAQTDPISAAENAARSVRGFQAYLIDKLTIDRYVNPLTGEDIAHAGFYLSSAEPWLAAHNDPGAIFASLTLVDIRGAGQNMDLPFWQGYHVVDGSGDFFFDGFDYADRAGSIYDPYFKYGNGVHASSLERFLARERDVDLAEVTDFIDLRLGELLADQGDLFRPKALILDDVVFFSRGC